MSRKILFLAAVILVSAATGTSAAVEKFFAEGQTVRIGILLDRLAVTVGSTAGLEFLDDETGVTLTASVPSETSRVLLSSGGEPARITRVWRVQVKAASTMQGALASRSEIEKVTAEEVHIEYIDPWYKVQVGDFSSRAEALELRDYLRKLGADGAWVVESIVPASVTAGLVVEKGKKVVAETDTPIRVRPLGSGMVTVDGRRYRGEIVIRVNDSGRIDVVNHVGLEQYLYGVLAAEMPWVKKDQLEAMKAQAVAARTYTVRNLGRFASAGYDLCSTTQCQVYRGVDGENDLVRWAVDETAGLIATYGDEAIEAVYHANAGGHTADAESVWKGSSVPYLRGIPETGFHKLSGIPLEFGREDPKFHWEVTWTAEQLNRILNRYLPEEVGGFAENGLGELVDILVTETDSSGRVQGLEFRTTSGSYLVEKDRVRWVLRQHGDHILPSSLFRLEVKKKDGRVAEVKAIGRGQGHGLGISQHGAMSMAAAGYTFDEILRHYYKGVEIVSLEEYVDRRRELQTASAEWPVLIKGVRVIGDWSDRVARKPKWSPDGVNIAYTDADRANIWVTGVSSGREWKIASGNGVGLEYVWSAAGDELIYAERVEHLGPFRSSYELKAADLVRGVTRTLASGINLTSLSWQERGPIFLEESGDLKLLWGNSMSDLVLGARYPTLSHDQRHVAYITNHEVWLYDMDTGRRERVSDMPLTGELVWSPDQRFIAVEMLGVIHVLSMDGELVYSTEGGGPSFSHDGRYLAYHRMAFDGALPAGSDIFITSVGEWEEVNFTYSDNVMEADPVWAPDSMSLAFVRMPKGKQLPLDGGESSIWVVSLQEKQ